MVAQNIGAGRWDRVTRITATGLAINAGLTAMLSTLLSVAGRPVLSAFLPPNSAALPIALRIDGIVTWSFVLFGSAQILFGTVRANGRVWGPLAILIVAMFPVRVGFSYAFLPAYGADALWWSFPIAFAAAQGMATAYFLLSQWRRGKPAAPVDCMRRVQSDAEPTGSVRPVAA